MRPASLLPLVLLILLAAWPLMAQPSGRTLAFTLDILPYAVDPGETWAARRATEVLLAALARHRVLR